jgi:hypothetical protein
MFMAVHISRDHADLIIRILGDRIPHITGRVADMLPLTQQERVTICDVLSDELSATGLNEAGDLNPRGELIESLIDALNPRLAD